MYNDWISIIGTKIERLQICTFLYFKMMYFLMNFQKSNKYSNIYFPLRILKFQKTWKSAQIFLILTEPRVGIFLPYNCTLSVHICRPIGCSKNNGPKFGATNIYTFCLTILLYTVFIRKNLLSQKNFRDRWNFYQIKRPFSAFKVFFTKLLISSGKLQV